MPPVIHGKNKDEITVWKPPEVGSPPCKLSVMHPHKQEEELAVIKKQAFEQGWQEGLASGQEQAQKYLEKIKYSLHLLDNPLKLIDQDLEKQLLSLVMGIVKQCIHRELRLEPELILKIIDEAKMALPAAKSDYQLTMNPEDARVFTEFAKNNDVNSSVPHIIEDISLARGEIHLSNSDGDVDGTIEARIKRMTEHLFE
jgi:flagellar assembly protein FliH